MESLHKVKEEPEPVFELTVPVATCTQFINIVPVVQVCVIVTHDQLLSVGNVEEERLLVAPKRYIIAPADRKHIELLE